VNAALYLRRPLLVTGRPGTGKSSLAYAIAYQLQLGTVLKWSINTRTTLNDGLYRYDAISRLQDAQLENHTDIGKYVQLGSLGTAFLPNKKPRVLLIDEVDKSDIDLPNDLLNLFEDGEFEIPELARIADQQKSITVSTHDNQKAEIIQGRVACQEFPLVIMTSNGERDFPPAFLRRCLQLEMPQPNVQQITQIVESHFVLEQDIFQEAEELIKEFVKRRDRGQNLATDQLLNVIFMLTGKKSPSKEDKEILLQSLLQPLDRVRGEY
jgi:MoxR-like ATPase